MSELEASQAAFRALKPRYRWLVRGLILCLLMGITLLLCAFNLLLAAVLGLKSGVPVKEQPMGQVWFVLLMIQIVTVIPMAGFGGRRLLARIAGKRRGWSPQQIKDIGAGRSYPPEWTT